MAGFKDVYPLPSMPDSTEQVLAGLVAMVRPKHYNTARDQARLTVELPAIAELVGLSDRQTQRHLKLLATKFGLVERIRGGGGAPTTYVISGWVLRAADATLTGR